MKLLQNNAFRGNKLNCFKAMQVLGGPTHILIWGSEIAKSESVKKGVWVNPLKKENLGWKSFFQIMLNEVLKMCEKWYLLMWKLIQITRNKRSSGCILQIFISTSKTWNTV